MQRRAWTMQIKPGCEAEYKKRHDEIWPELSAALSEAGIKDYAIFLEPSTGKLFAVQKVSDGHTADDLPSHPIVRKWWDYMADLMDTHPDHEPVCGPLDEVFYMA